MPSLVTLSHSRTTFGHGARSGRNSIECGAEAFLLTKPLGDTTLILGCGNNFADVAWQLRALRRDRRRRFATDWSVGRYVILPAR